MRSIAKGHRLKSLPVGLGLLPQSIGGTAEESLWFHAVSVGEVQSSVPFLKAIQHQFPSIPLYVSIGTATGLKLAQGQLAGIAAGVFRAPLDLPWCVNGVLRRLRPRLLIIAETELWPNYFFQAARRGVPVMIVNGRISDRAAPRYRRFRMLFGPVLRCARSILVQSETDRERFVSLGARPRDVVLGGNLKYELPADSPEAALPEDIRSFIDRADPAFVLVAGSTREGEEELLAPILRDLLEQEPRSLAIVAPRHPHRFAEAATVLASAAVPVIRRSKLPATAGSRPPMVMVLDSIGELAAVYARADLVFVGGSLNGWGGHNVLEPILHGKPVVVGPHMQNFRDITADLLGARGMIQVQDLDGLRTKLLDLAADEEQREQLGSTGRRFAASKSGASNRAASVVARLWQDATLQEPPSAIAVALLGLPAAAWCCLAGLRRAAFRRGILASKSLTTPTVSIGNLTAGGTGKTPTVAWLVEQLAQRGHSAAVLTRGYGREQASTIRVAPVSEDLDARSYGDEPAMLARQLQATAPRSLIAVGTNRHAAGREVEKEAGVDFLVLDDGFQHMRLGRALNIVLVSVRQPFENGHCLPLGRLREPVDSLRDADVVVLTRCAVGGAYAHIHDAIRAVNPLAGIYHSRVLAKGLVDIRTGESVGAKRLAGVPIATFCGIGDPGSFQAQVREIGLTAVMHRSFSDHHRYTSRELAGLSRAAAERGAQALLTTVKDSINMGSGPELGMPAYALRIAIEIDNCGQLVESVLRAARS